MTDYPYVKKYTDRTGKPRAYYRHGIFSHPLPPNVGSDEFLRAYEDARSRDYLLGARSNTTPAERKEKRFATCLQRVFMSTQKRAAARGLPIDLTLQWFKDQVAAQDYKCALTGLDFCDKRPSKTLRNPYAPSIDRVDNNRGYLRGNVRIVLASVNIAINEWGEDHFRTICLAYSARRAR